jgi:hypothetical protein
VQTTCVQSLQQQQRHASKPWVPEGLHTAVDKTGSVLVIVCPVAHYGGSSLGQLGAVSSTRSCTV